MLDSLDKLLKFINLLFSLGGSEGCVDVLRLCLVSLDSLIEPLLVSLAFLDNGISEFSSDMGVLRIHSSSPILEIIDDFLEVLNRVSKVFVLSESLVGGLTQLSEFLSSLDVDRLILFSTLSVEPGLLVIERGFDLADQGWVSEFSVGSVDNLVSVVVDVALKLVLSELGFLDSTIIVVHLSLEPVEILNLLLGDVVNVGGLSTESGSSLLFLLLDLVLGLLLHLSRLLSLSGSLLVGGWLLGSISLGGLRVLLDLDLLLDGVVLDQAAVGEGDKSALIQLDSDLDSELGLLDLGWWDHDADQLAVETFRDGVVVKLEVDLLLVLEGQTLDVGEDAALLEQLSALGLDLHSAVLLGDELPLNLDIERVAVFDGVGEDVELG